MLKTIGFGEIMGRLNMPGYSRFKQGLPGDLEVTFAGAESNVCATVAMLGQEAAFITALPEHEVAEAAVMALKRLGVDTSGILRVPIGRLGTYFVENGANQRPGKVIYDRSYSSVSLTQGTSYNWQEIFKDANWFHISGITPALSLVAAEATELAVKEARKYGLTVSLDLNFRKKLWRWDDSKLPKELARTTMNSILPYVDVIIGNEEDAEDVLGIKAGDTDVYQGSLDIERYPEVARQIVSAYPQINKVAITLRESLSASHNNWGAMLYDAQTETPSFAPLNQLEEYHPYEIRNIVDRIGGGDSFSGSLVFALQDEELKTDDRKVLDFAVAASCLCHSIPGDFNFVSRDEVLSLAYGNTSGRVKR